MSLLLLPMMMPFIGFTCPPTIHFKFITKGLKCYYKVRWSVITKCHSFFITKYDKCYYKVRQFYYKVRQLSKSVTEQRNTLLSDDCKTGFGTKILDPSSVA